MDIRIRKCIHLDLGTWIVPGQILTVANLINLSYTLVYQYVDIMSLLHQTLDITEPQNEFCLPSKTKREKQKYNYINNVIIYCWRSAHTTLPTFCVGLLFNGGGLGLPVSYVRHRSSIPDQNSKNQVRPCLIHNTSCIIRYPRGIWRRSGLVLRCMDHGITGEQPIINILLLTSQYWSSSSSSLIKRRSGINPIPPTDGRRPGL